MRLRLLLRAGAVLSAAALVLTGVVAAPAQAAVGQITGIGGKCVDVAAANPANGTTVQLYTCNGTNAQQWTTGQGQTIRALGKCLDVAAAGTANGTRVQLYDCNGSAAQNWTPQADGTLRALGKCLDATGNSSADGTPLQIWDCFAGANQRWTLPTGGGNPDPDPGNPAKFPGTPYLYLGWGSPPSATSIMSQTGVRSFTMAFILSGGGCVPRWDGQRPLTGGTDQSTINAIKAAGGQVQISFGGWSGNKLGPNCSTPAAFAGAVQQVINAHGPNVVDFDVENTDEMGNYTVQDRILNGIKIIKQNNPNVRVVVTIGTSQSGPAGAEARFLQQARALNVPIDNYTLMPFNFGASNIYNATVSASEGLKNQLKSLWGYTDAQAYARMGISGMNGYSDNSEITTVATWTQIRDWARARGLGRLAFWSVNRDRPCSGALNDTCSGVAQANWDFTRITAGF
ncbi:ricin-type beta-trefoil lectin domain protein [Herbidospora sp. NBRC 101105]|uniref:ricin-type beta-trefoil lectin domain protein n=1 Tax=Herbidospora sp. NBRC 101105 TaxID=3032195 RepID=UPI0024A4CC3B|nr:ricin-type beta-trefoil lectin domain protein [Herbidospora sp. NBRC 101105]GLX99170.1 chitinase [Herbidospora sp. NBRC 101105]